mgnify:CR=1 FL=1
MKTSKNHTMYLKDQGLTETQTTNYCIGMMYSVTRAVLSFESYPRTKLFAWSAEKIFDRGLRNFVRGYREYVRGSKNTIE